MRKPPRLTVVVGVAAFLFVGCVRETPIRGKFLMKWEYVEIQKAENGDVREMGDRKAQTAAGGEALGVNNVNKQPTQSLYVVEVGPTKAKFRLTDDKDEANHILVESGTTQDLWLKGHGAGIRVRVESISAINKTPAKTGKDESPGEKTEVDKLQGVWEVTSWTEQGVQDRNFVEFASPRLVFNGGKHAWKAGAGSHEGTFKVGSKGNLRTLDLTITTAGKGSNQIGIYEMNGDELKICFARVDTAQRPATFASKADGAEYVLVVLKRRKEK